MDIVDLAAFREQLAVPGSVFVEETFTPGERRASGGRAGDDPARHLAARFAAKEAFIKAWSGSRRGHAPKLTTVDLREIEVVHDAWGRPSLELHGTLAEVVGDVALQVSLTHDGGYAAAVVMLQG
jgi:holo-[acyl-carrier protein] synthase